MIKLARRKFRAGAPEVCAAIFPASVVFAEAEVFSV
jgi:hypothetical protein